MVDIPRHVDEWSIGKITDLIHEGYDENQTLEFKKSVNPEGHRIATTACTFANTMGGYLIFGIDSDRSKNYQERLVGVDNVDQTKRQIIDKINQINPHIPVQNLQFKKNNIILPNGKVIIILQISNSFAAPHQFEHKFYKRLPDGNEPMTATEVKNVVINSQKNRRLYNLMVNELGVMLANYEQSLILLDKNLTADAIMQCELTANDSLQHFLYNQSVFYSNEFQNLIEEIFHISQKLSYGFGRVYDNLELKDDKEYKEFLERNNTKSSDELMKRQVGNMLNIILNDLDQFEKITGQKLPAPRDLSDTKIENKPSK